MNLHIQATFGSDQIVHSTSVDDTKIPFFNRCLPTTGCSTMGLLALLVKWAYPGKIGSKGLVVFSVEYVCT